MRTQEAIEAIKANYPPENYQMLREGLDLAIKALEQVSEIKAIIKAIDVPSTEEEAAGVDFGRLLRRKRALDKIENMLKEATK